MAYEEQDTQFGEHVIANQILYNKDGVAVLVVADGVLRSLAVRDEETASTLGEVLKTLRRIEIHLASATGEKIADEDIEG